MPSNKKILILPGDGIGLEVMNEVLNIIEWMTKNKSISFDISNRLVGGAAYDIEGDSISDETMQEALNSDAVLFGAVGDPKIPDDILAIVNYDDACERCWFHCGSKTTVLPWSLLICVVVYAAIAPIGWQFTTFEQQLADTLGKSPR